MSYNIEHRIKIVAYGLYERRRLLAEGGDPFSKKFLKEKPQKELEQEDWWMAEGIVTSPPAIAIAEVRQLRRDLKELQEQGSLEQLRRACTFYDEV